MNKSRRIPLSDPSRGDIWLVDFNPTRGHEQAGKRPCLVISVNAFNYGPADLIIGIPITTKSKGIALHVPVDPPEGGLKQKSFIKCEDLRSLSKDRFESYLGLISKSTMEAVEDRLRILMGL